MRPLLFVLLWAPLMLQAAPDINIGAMYDYMEGQKSTLLKRVRNAGDATAFVKVSVAELIYDQDGNSREVPVDGDAAPGASTRSLVVSPARLIVPASGMQTLRLLYMGEREFERYFRVRFEPVLPDQGDGFGLSASQSSDYRQALSTGINVMAGYGAILFVRPTQPLFRAELKEEPHRFLVANVGNTTLILDHFNDCSADGKRCEVPSKYHVRPGTERVFEKAAGRSYRFDLIEGEKTRTVEIAG
ncbi:molecular chaperone [Pseudomonas sp. LS1212]|uniref:molecular chaperone n=1 Tax=Pseudomonas sp. LS1212 TaxID=2972478 RepID=UPI00215BD865|nr:molecular chaperone [Pseudomonas sp. LS1212]UVJ43868.1 molecular chaperone [Pseudomonas sp. LS1212]